MTGEATLTRSRTAVATAAVAGLELVWLYTLLYSTSRGMHIEVSIPSLLSVYAGAFVLGLGMRAVHRSPRVTRVVSWFVWPFATLLLLMVLLYPDAGPADGSWTAVLLHALRGIVHEAEAAIYIVVAAGILWWLGARLASCRMNYETVVTEFQLGLVPLAGSIFIGYLAGVDQPAAIPAAVIFVGLSLLGAAATRAADEGGPWVLRQGGAWWVMLVVSVGLVLLLGLVAGILFTPELMQLVGRGIRAVWGLIDWLISALAGLFSQSAPEMELPPFPEMPPPQEDEPGFTWALPEWLSSPLRVVYVVVLGGLALAAIWRVASSFFDWMRRRMGRRGVQIESLPGAFRLDLARLFRRILGWLSGLLAFGRLRSRPRDESPRTTCVRRLYADMLRWGAKSGFPRGPSQTPFEYQQTLCVALPAYQADVTSITESYVRVKYGAQSPTEGELHELKESRRRLKRKASHGNKHR